MKKGDPVKLRASIYEGRRLYPEEEGGRIAMQLRKVTAEEFAQLKAQGRVEARTIYKADVMHMDWTYEVKCTTCMPIYPGLTERSQFISVLDPAKGYEFFVREQHLDPVEQSQIILS